MHEAPFLFAFVEFVNSMAFCASELHIQCNYANSMQLLLNNFLDNIEPS
jgi:hypothetical protein